MRKLAGVGLVAVVFTGGYAVGRHDALVYTEGCRVGLANVEDARQAEYRRVVAAIARTMRCSTVDEFDRGQDHQCAPDEIVQDAGLVDGDGKQIR